MEAGPLSTDAATGDDRVSTLRGAGVTTVDRKRLLWLAVVAVILGLVIGSVALYVAGARKNAQIADLRQHGVPVEVTITGCQGLLGGSGSNAAGYACRGTFTLDGQRDDEALPGDTLLSPGTKIRAVAVPGNPGLVSTPAVLAGEHTSEGVYVLPSVLAALAVVTLVAALTLRRRSRRAGGGGNGGGTGGRG